MSKVRNPRPDEMSRDDYVPQVNNNNNNTNPVMNDFFDSYPSNGYLPTVTEHAEPVDGGWDDEIGDITMRDINVKEDVVHFLGTGKLGNHDTTPKQTSMIRSVVASAVTPTKPIGGFRGGSRRARTIEDVANMSLEERYQRGYRSYLALGGLAMPKLDLKWSEDSSIDSACYKAVVDKYPYMELVYLVKRCDEWLGNVVDHDTRQPRLSTKPGTKCPVAQSTFDLVSKIRKQIVSSFLKVVCRSGEVHLYKTNLPLEHVQKIEKFSVPLMYLVILNTDYQSVLQAETTLLYDKVTLSGVNLLNAESKDDGGDGRGADVSKLALYESILEALGKYVWIGDNDVSSERRGFAYVRQGLDYVNDVLRIYKKDFEVLGAVSAPHREFYKALRGYTLTDEYKKYLANGARKSGLVGISAPRFMLPKSSLPNKKLDLLYQNCAAVGWLLLYPNLLQDVVEYVLSHPCDHDKSEGEDNSNVGSKSNETTSIFHFTTRVPSRPCVVGLIRPLRISSYLETLKLELHSDERRILYAFLDGTLVCDYTINKTVRVDGKPVVRPVAKVCTISPNRDVFKVIEKPKFQNLHHMKSSGASMLYFNIGHRPRKSMPSGGDDDDDELEGFEDPRDRKDVVMFVLGKDLCDDTTAAWKSYLGIRLTYRASKKSKLAWISVGRYIKISSAFEKGNASEVDHHQANTFFVSTETIPPMTDATFSCVAGQVRDFQERYKRSDLPRGVNALGGTMDWPLDAVPTVDEHFYSIKSLDVCVEFAQKYNDISLTSARAKSESDHQGLCSTSDRLWRMFSYGYRSHCTGLFVLVRELNSLKLIPCVALSGCMSASPDLRTIDLESWDATSELFIWVAPLNSSSMNRAFKCPMKNIVKFSLKSKTSGSTTRTTTKMNLANTLPFLRATAKMDIVENEYMVTNSNYTRAWIIRHETHFDEAYSVKDNYRANEVTIHPFELFPGMTCENRM